MRPSHGSLVYAALIFQGLYYVPQVRRSIASWRPTLDTPDAEFILPPTSGGGLLASLFVLNSYSLLPRLSHVDVA